MSDLVQKAKERLREIEETDTDELGEVVTLEVGDFFHGRYRGSATLTTKERDAVEVVALWDEDGDPRFAWPHAALVSELAEASPEIGDEIAIVRGEDKEYESRGRASDEVPLLGEDGAVLGSAPGIECAGGR